MKKRSVVTNYSAGDFLIRIKNSAMAGRTELNLANTKFISAIAKALKDEGYLSEVKLDKGILTVKIAQAHKKPILGNLKLISKPGLRVYQSIDKLKSRKAESSILVLSTPKGIMSNAKAIKNNVGGEVIAEVW